VIGRAIAKPLLQHQRICCTKIAGRGRLTSRLLVGTQDEIGELAITSISLSKSARLDENRYR
jgi:methyl-accepting chemotaxis protein